MENFSGIRRNNQLSNTRRSDYHSDGRNNELFQRRVTTSGRQNDSYLGDRSDLYLDLQDRQSDNVTDGWNHLLNNRNDLLDSRNDVLNNRNYLLDNQNDLMDDRNHQTYLLDDRNRQNYLDEQNNQNLEKQYDQYISELGSKSHYSDMGLSNANSNLGRYSRSVDFDRNTVSSDRFAGLERSSMISNFERNNVASGLGQNTFSSLTQNSRILELERSNLRGNPGSSSITPWQVGAGPANNSSLPVDTVSNKVATTLELATNIISLLQQQPQQNTLPSLLDLPVHAPQSAPFKSGRGNSMGNQQRSATDSRSGAGKRKANWTTAGQNQQSKNLPKKDTNSFKTQPKMSAQSSSNAGKPKAKVNQQGNSDYNDVARSLLSCHICKKTMTAPTSFAAHLMGKAHAAMMKKTEEAYAVTADEMREEIRALEAMKPNKQTARNFHCLMCKVNAADSREHRGSVGHRKLKKYLHPTCNICNVNFPTRIAYDEHILTVGHMKKLKMKQDSRTSSKTEDSVSVPTARVLQLYNMDMEKIYVRERIEKKKKTEKDDKSKENDSKVQNGSKDEDKVDPDNLVLDYVEGDDLTGVTPDMIPSYSTERSVGDSFLSEFRCTQCNLCDKLFDSEDTAKVHLRTWGHHRQFTKLILKKIKSTKVNDDQNKDSESTGEKQETSISESGNWKRRKTSDKSFVVEQEQQDDDKMSENDETSTKKEVDSQLPPNEELEDWDQGEDDIMDIKQEKDDDVVFVED